MARIVVAVMFVLALSNIIVTSYIVSRDAAAGEKRWLAMIPIATMALAVTALTCAFLHELR